MRDNEDDDEQKPEDFYEQPQARGNFNVEGGNHGAMVQEAKKLMAADDDDEPVANTGDEGPKIKMGRIGKKKKKGAAATTGDKPAADSYTKKIRRDEPESRQVGGGFNDSDVEFMKKAIQILCQSTLPLGKSIDFVTDDVDSMSKEYEHWRREAITCTQ